MFAHICKKRTTRKRMRLVGAVTAVAANFGAIDVFHIPIHTAQGLYTPRSFAVSSHFDDGHLSAVRSAFLAEGFREVKPWQPWTVFWGVGGSVSLYEYPSLRAKDPVRKFNHFPCTGVLGEKDKLWMAVSRARHRACRGRPRCSFFDFIPTTFLMPRDAEALLKSVARRHPDSLFIIKPKSGARGEGVSVVHARSLAGGGLPAADTLVQDYISDPALIDGHKATLRVYVAATSMNPLRVYLFRDGFAHVATRPYAPSSSQDIRAHVTNPDVQGTAYHMRGRRGNSKFYMPLNAYLSALRRAGIDPSLVRRGIERVAVETLLAARDEIGYCVDKFGRPGSNFEVWGLDILVDREAKVWLLEVNHTPSTNTDFALAKRVKGDMLRGLLRIAMPQERDWNAAKSLVEARFRQLGWRRGRSASDPRVVDAFGFESLVDAEVELALSQATGFFRVFPRRGGTRRTLPLLSSPPYLDALLHAWERANTIGPL